MCAEGAKQKSKTDILSTHSVGLLLGKCVGCLAGGVTVGEVLGAALAKNVVKSVGVEERGFAVAHSVQHSQPCSAQSTLRISNFSNRQISFGNLPFNWLFSKVNVSKFTKSARLSGTHPVR